MYEGVHGSALKRWAGSLNLLLRPSALLNFYNCVIKEIDFDGKRAPNVQTDTQLK